MPTADDLARFVAAIAALPDIDIMAMREAFTSFGCCGVMDQLRELEDLHLLRAPERATP